MSERRRVERWLKELDYYAVAEVEEEGEYVYYVEFKVYAIEGISHPEGKPLFHEAGATSSPSPVEALAEAETYLHGSVKWDGCSNWSIDENKRVMLHFCDSKSAGNLGRVLEACYDIAEELMPQLAEYR